MLWIRVKGVGWLIRDGNICCSTAAHALLTLAGMCAGTLVHAIGLWLTCAHLHLEHVCFLYRQREEIHCCLTDRTGDVFWPSYDQAMEHYSYSWREECICSISFSVTQHSYELFTLVISPCISDLVVPELCRRLFCLGFITASHTGATALAF